MSELDYDIDYNSDIRVDLNQNGYTDGRLVGISRDELDSVFAEGLGGLYTAATRAFRGINHYNTGPAFPANYDLHGYTFFTRPRMKLGAKNCLRDRTLTYMLTDDPLTIPRIVRAYLDPLGSGTPAKISAPDASLKEEKYPCPLVDPLNPFISILSNSLTSLTGWPDINVDTFDSDAGLQKEQWSTYDGIAKYYGTFNLNASFTNMRGDPLGLLFMTWVTYGTRIAWDEMMIPWVDAVLDHEKDFETRIYRLIMDPTKTYVQKIACTGASFPTNANTGGSYDYDANKPVNSKLDQHSMSFKCQGALYYDPFIAVAFNITVTDFNPNMRPGFRQKHYTKIHPSERIYFKDEGYPWINTKTSELEWYVPNARYKQVMESTNG